jgi:iron complex transport system substrate-binding protein
MPTIDMMNLEVESMIALNPDFVFTSGIVMMGDEENDPLSPLKDLGIGVAYIPSSDTIEGIKEDLRFVAAVTDTREVGEQLIATMVRELEEIAALIDDEVRPIVYFEISPAPDMFSFGADTFQHAMLVLSGGENIFADVSGWIPVEAESVISANPEVIFTSVNFIDDPVAEILSRPGFEGVDAVVHERVYYIDNDYMSIPTHHITRAMLEMVQHLHGN